jgi:D-alanyl-D-alanine endopeptidase (penicillin-binding protein 7)
MIQGVAVGKSALGVFFSLFSVILALPAEATVRSDRSLNSRERLVRKVVLVHGKRRVSYQRVVYAPTIPAVPPVLTAGDLAGLNLTRDPLDLKSNAALVVDQNSSEVLFEKNARVALPIASITKLMTSLVVVEADQDMDELLSVTEDDVDKEKNSHSRLRVGSQLTRANMLHIALMSSENRAASALGRHYPGGLPAFVAAMNAKAQALGMTQTRYVDSTGLSSNNIASARDLAKLVVAAHQHPVIRQYSTDSKYAVDPGGPVLQYRNSNHLVENPTWEIGLQKTGFISEAGRCLVMQAMIEGRAVVMVFLDSKGKQSRLADAGRIRKWLEAAKPPALTRRIGTIQS